MIDERGKKLLSDVLCNASLHNTGKKEDTKYGKGIVVGVATALMAFHNCEMELAGLIITILSDDHPLNSDCVPEEWRKFIRCFL